MGSDGGGGPHPEQAVIGLLPWGADSHLWSDTLSPVLGAVQLQREKQRW